VGLGRPPDGDDLTLRCVETWADMQMNIEGVTVQTGAAEETEQS
jgi:hypothetical protein